VPKVISKCCELVKLCHINRSGPVFWRQCILYRYWHVQCRILAWHLILSRLWSLG